MPILSSANFSTPAPKWFRVTKKIISNGTNLTLAILAMRGYADSSPTLLVIKLVQSFVVDTLDSFLGNGEIYAPKSV